MDKDQLKQTIQTLNQELDSETAVDPETRELLSMLDEDIHRLIAEPAQPSATDTEGIMEKAEALAAHFAAEHPTAEALLREIVASLAKMGV